MNNEIFIVRKLFLNNFLTVLWGKMLQSNTRKDVTYV